MMLVSSQCAMRSSGEREKSRWSVSCRSTSMSPVLLPMKTLTPGTLCWSSIMTVSVLVLVLVLGLAFPRHLLEAICCVGAVEEVAGDRAGETESVGAVDAELVCSAGDRAQRQLGDAIVPLQYRILRKGGFAILVYITQQTGEGPPCNGRVDDATVFTGTAKDQGVVSLFDLVLRQKGIQDAVDVGVFGKQHNAEGVPIQPCDGVERTILSGFLVITHDPVGQSAGQTGTGRVDQHTRRLVHD